MIPSTQTVFDIFQKERRYVVPLFQRQYVWDQENQWEPLWSDLERQAIHAAEALARQEEPRTTHFLGAVVLNARKTVGLGHPISEIIDGQQRLTTLQIFLAALRDYASRLDEEAADELGRLTRNPNRRRDPEGRFKVWPTNYDRPFFTQIMEAGDREAVTAVAPEARSVAELPRMAQAYMYFADRIRAFVEGSDLPEPLGEQSSMERLEGLIYALRTSLVAVIIELEEGDDPQVIFETLNARGEPLLPSDLIRNYLFLKASGERDDAEQLYETYWAPFDNTPALTHEHRHDDRFWHVKETQGRLQRARIDLFIFHYVTMYAEREVLIGRIFREFQTWYKEAATGVETVLSDMAAKRELFAQLLVPDESTRLLTLAKRLKSLDTNTPFPILLFLMSQRNRKIAPATIEKIAADLDSYLVRRFVCGYTGKNYNRFFVGLLRTLRQATDEGRDPHSAVREALLEPSGSAGVWPDDRAFLRAWLNRGVYFQTRPDRSVMLLRAIEDQLRRDNAKSEAHTPPDNLTVEHLMPRAADPEVYPIPEAATMPPHEDESVEQRRQRLLHTIGNLTLLTDSLNAGNSNDPFTQKRSEIADHSDLRLNARFRDPQITRWTEPEIVQRGLELFEPALRIWPHPHGQAGGREYITELSKTALQTKSNVTAP